MKIRKSCIVISLAGRDAGRLFIVLDVIDDIYALLADGNIRRVESPKKKKLKHMAFFDINDTRSGDKIRNGEKVTNAEIRRTLSQFSNEFN